MSEPKKTNGLSLIANDSVHMVMNADVTFNVEEQESTPSVHIADVVYTLVLDALKKQAENAKLFPGEYRLILTGCACSIPSVVQGEPDGSNDDDEEATEEGGEAAEVSEETTEAA